MAWRPLAAMLSALIGVSLLAAPAQGVTITEFPIEPGVGVPKHAPYFIVAGPGGRMWFTNAGTSKSIGRISTAGQFLPLISEPNVPFDIAAPGDGSVWWTGTDIRRSDADGNVTTFKSASASHGIGMTELGKMRWEAQMSTKAFVCKEEGGSCSGPFSQPAGNRFTDLSLAPDGKLWVTSYEADRVHVMTDALNITLSVELPVDSGPYRIAAGPDGKMWVANYKANAIDRITPTGDRVRFALPAGAGPNDIVAGPDGAMWFTEFDGARIGRMTTDGQLTNEFPVPTPNSTPFGIGVGPDGAIWFTESTSGKIGRLVLDSPGGGGGGGGPGGGGGSGGPVSDRFAPLFSRALGLSRSRFRVAVGATPVSVARTRRAPVPRGSALTFSLSEPAAVTIVIAKAAAGRRVGRLCLRLSRGNRSRPRCTRYVAAGTLRRRGLQNANRIAFTGRIGRRALPAGRYRATASARDAAGNVSRLSRASFTVVAG